VTTSAKGVVQAYRHEAVLYRGVNDYVDSLVPFIAEGLQAGEPVLVAVPTERLATLRAALRGATGVSFVDMSEVGANPARILPTWQAFVDDNRSAGTRLRGVGESIWAGRRPVELAECNRYEALFNIAVHPQTPLWLRCPYDVSALESGTILEAERNHPWVVENGIVHAGVDHHADDPFMCVRQRLAEPAALDWDVIFDVTGVRTVRERVAAHATDGGISRERTDDLLLAVHEVVVSSLRRGGGSGRLRLWRDDASVVCEIRDRGRIVDPLVGCRMPSSTALSGRGMWMVQQLVDLAQVRSSSGGTTVRMHTWR
jgi:anti-sigma regulatory factor (Ser/Thr protein kinase)